MWLADDGQVPTHLPNLTPSLASQITQVWAVNIDCFKTPQQVLQGLPPPEEPDFEPPLHPSPLKRARLEQQHNILHFGNVTNFGKQVIEWYWTRDSGVYIFAETHLYQQRHHELCQYFSIRGRTVFGTPAESNPDNTGTHGGMLVLADPASGLTPFEAYTNSGCGYQSFLWQATETTILVIGIYLRTGETFQSEVNSDILANLLALLTNTTHPYVIIGDWQNQPHTLASTVLPAKFQFGILAPDHSVLSGNTIDYAILHNTLAGTTSITTEWAVPWRPHTLLKLQFDIEAATKLYRQMPYYPPLPKVPDIDFRTIEGSPTACLAAAHNFSSRTCSRLHEPNQACASPLGWSTHVGTISRHLSSLASISRSSCGRLDASDNWSPTARDPASCQ